MDSRDTIFALSSAYGKAGVSVFRMSGVRSFDILKKLSGRKNIIPKEMFFCALSNPQNKDTIDRCMAVFLPAPRTYTGEDVVEFFIHGSIAVIDEMYRVLAEFENVRIAEPGEFTKRSFLNGKLDLTEVEATADLIAAQTDAERRLALSSVSGMESKLYNSWRERLLKILAWNEASIDFSDDEMPENIISQNDIGIKKLIKEMEDHIATFDIAKRIKGGLNVVIIGKPNVGKSSLFNKILGENRAIVSNIKGTTRDILESIISVDGFKINLFDTAGLNEKSIDIIEKKGMAKAKKLIKEADIKIFIVSNIRDIKNLDTDDDSIILLNKIDKLKDLKPIKGVIPISIKTGKGFNKFFNSLRERITKKMLISSDATLSQQRYRDAILNSLAELKGAISEERIDIKVEGIRIALNHIASITGQVYFSEMLDEIFSSFCLGK